jgi:hypothetical protein
MNTPTFWLVSLVLQLLCFAFFSGHRAYNVALFRYDPDHSARWMWFSAAAAFYAAWQLGVLLSGMCG